MIFNPLAPYLSTLAAKVPAEGVPLYEALAEGRYHFRFEQWLSLGDDDSPVRPLPAEMLLRAYDRNGAIKAEQPIAAFNKAGLADPLNKALVFAALREARGRTPVSINVATSAALFAPFWHWVQETVNHQNPDIPPSDIVFELTEDHTGQGLPLTTMDAMRTLGYRFALDDVRDCERDFTRIENAASVIDFIKIDGSLIARSATEPTALRDMSAFALSRCPWARLVAEHVHTPYDALRLALEFNIHAVQSRNLPETQAAFSRGLRAARTVPRLAAPAG